MSSHRRSTLARTDENLSDDSDLVKVELDRRLAAKDHQRDLELASLGVNLGDLAIKVGKRAIGDADGRADLNIDRGALAKEKPYQASNVYPSTKEEFPGTETCTGS